MYQLSLRLFLQTLDYFNDETVDKFEQWNFSNLNNQLQRQTKLFTRRGMQ